MLKLDTKANTLKELKQKLSHSHICDSVIFTVRDWNSNQDQVLGQVKDHLQSELVIVRSSATTEDSEVSAKAGEFDSVANVDRSNSEHISTAVQKVISSYQKNQEFAEDHQIFIQPMITNVSMSGVLFTRDMHTGAPYYVINYDDTSGKTDTVTAGKDLSRTLLVHRKSVEQLSSTRFLKLLKSVQEIESLYPDLALDIEFAVDPEERIYIFQVRRLVMQTKWNPKIDEIVNHGTEELVKFMGSLFSEQHGVLGKTTLLAEMSDWNPAEMIGSSPSPLALSLYRHLITNSVWAEARAEMGYRSMKGFDLMVSLGGKPYIDVRKSFNSFLPASLPEEIGSKVVNYWLQKLTDYPEYHDKIEFEVATTVYTPGLNGFSEFEFLSAKEKEQYQNSLFQLTNQWIKNFKTEFVRLDQELVLLDEKRKSAIDHSRKYPQHDLHTIQTLLEDCRELGTKPFAIFARCAFISESFLRSFQKLEALSVERIKEFKSSVSTVLGDFLEKLKGLQNGHVSRDDFMKEFGHLRPGTYDILSSRYDQRADFVPTTQLYSSSRKGENKFHWTEEELTRVNNVLKKEGFSFDSKWIFSFIHESIVKRELAKLKFTKNISDALEMIAQWGERNSLSRQELSYLKIHDFTASLVYHPTYSLREYFLKIIQDSKEQFEGTRAIRTPYLIQDLSDVQIVPLLKSKPNFVTSRIVEAPTVYLTGKEESLPDLKNKIVCIEGADPGYDWIFTYPIAGLVTKYGGANSHMAIRCGELDLPAAIGCGEQIFESCIQSEEVRMDCMSQLIFVRS